METPQCEPTTLRLVCEMTPMRKLSKAREEAGERRRERHAAVAAGDADADLEPI
jgi:hypothetical protein